MNRLLRSGSVDAKEAVAALFESSPPVLVEVRFPNMGTSPDWHLCEEEDQLEQILNRLSPGVELYISSVWDLKNVKGAIGLKK
jgi:hypothetical protein